MQLPDDYLPEWLKTVITLALGAGGVAWFRVWLENRRLARKDFRETLLDRVRELEKVVAHTQVRMGNLRVEMAHLEVENAQLRRELGLPERMEQRDADTGRSEGGDDGKSA